MPLGVVVSDDNMDDRETQLDEPITVPMTARPTSFNFYANDGVVEFNQETQLVSGFIEFGE
uniref:Outer membrane protein n=1 Tax=Angiostrongylus cantonensis TaxID=6313 RepID=A0A0K0DRB2_ANGCA